MQRFGIVFNPLEIDVKTATNVGVASGKASNLRSLLIQNIPSEYSIHNLLAHVRGGSIVVARLVPDTMKAGYNQVAIITFKTAEEASTGEKLTSALLSYSEATGARFLDSDSKMTVTLLPTPTYPSRELIDLTVIAPGFNLAPVEIKTRCIYVIDFPRQYVHELCTELMLTSHQSASKIRTLEEMWFEGDTLRMQFTSMRAAEIAHNIISIFHFRKYSGHVHYGPDPCAEPIVSINDLCAGGTIKVASNGYMGLKSLLESVGLASFSRCHGKLSAAAVSDRRPPPVGLTKMSFSTLLSQTRTLQARAPRISSPRPTINAQTSATYPEPVEIFIDASVKDTKSDLWSSSTTPVHDGFWSSVAGAPWTAEQMVGLDML